MQASNFTDSDIRYIVDGETDRRSAPRRLPIDRLQKSVPLPPRSYTASPGGDSGMVHFYVREGSDWVKAASAFVDSLSSALVTLLGKAGDYRLEIAYPRAFEVEAKLEDVRARQERRNAEAHAALLREFGSLSVSEVTDKLDSEQDGGSVWQQEGRIFGVTHEGQLVFPGFQFDSDGKPRAIIAPIIEALAQTHADWQLALWFTRANGWLGGRRPVDLLENEPEAVMEAVWQEATGLDF